MPPEEKARLNACLADYHRRVGLGEQVEPARYADELGGLFPEFEKLLVESAMIDDARRPLSKDALPRPFGGYTLLKELGRGASGVVYEAVHRELGRRVALKILRTGFDTHQTARERFRREARACAQVRHDNIVEIYEAGVEEDRPFYAMRLLEGESLEDMIRKDELPDLDTLCTQMADIAGALHTLHQAGIVHRDVKPSNLMVQPSGRFVLADFGLARTADAASLTQTGDALGTPLYMSPEQMLGKRQEIDGRTDVYGLGATLYQSVTGKTPFDTRDLGKLLRMVLTERPTPPRKVNGTLPRECENIVLKCLEKRPQDRYETAAALEADLRAFARGDEVEGKPISAARHNMRRLITSPIGIAAIVLGILAGVLLGVQLVGDPAPRLSVTSTPQAVVWIDGQRLGETEIENAEVGEGTLKIEIRPKEDGYVTLVREWQAEPGGSKDITVMLPPTSWENRKALDDFVKEKLGDLKRARLEQPGRKRGAIEDTELPILIYPRGKIRIDDLKHKARVDIPELFDAEEPGEIVFALDGKDVARIAFPDPKDLYNLDLVLPPAVLEAARPGMQGTWRFVRGRKDRVEASFTIVEDEVASLLDSIDEQLGLHESAQAIRMVLRAEALLGAELHAAALRELLPWVDRRKKATYKRDLRVFLIADKALRGLFADERELEEVSELLHDIQSAIQDEAGWSDAQKDAAFDD
ncbi:MAG: serine/threonine-protein kinase [Planctomycetota bacterium]|nr:serine/threonine-protein kinase [Planctomycetota bacterium]